MRSLIASIVVGFLTTAAFSQSQQTTVTDEELKKYVMVIDSVNELSASVRIMIAEMVKNESTVSASRYNELSKMNGDSLKLVGANATPEEIAFMRKVAERKEQETQQINATFQKLAKEVATVPVFNKVKKAIASDPAVKARYDSLLAEMSKDNPVEG